MKITKVVCGECRQFDVSEEEFHLIEMALGDYYCFLEYSLKHNVVRTNSSDDAPFPLSDKIRERFADQYRVIKPMIEMVHLFS